MPARPAHDRATRAKEGTARHDAAGCVRELAEHDFVAVARPGRRAAYLQGQCSQDVAALAGGDSAWSFVLQPTGKVDVLAASTGSTTTTFVLDIDAGCGDALWPGSSGSCCA